MLPRAAEVGLATEPQRRLNYHTKFSTINHINSRSFLEWDFWAALLRSSLLEGAHRGAFQFTIGFSSLEVFTFIKLRFAFAYRERDFYFSILPIQRKRHQGVAFDRSQSEEFADFGLVQEQLPGGFGLMILQIAVGVLVDVGVIQEDFLVLDARKGVAELAFAGAQGLHLRAVQDNPRLEGLQDMVIPPGFRVGQDISHNKISQKVALLADRLNQCRGLLVLFALLGRRPRKFGNFRHFEPDFVLDDLKKRDIGSSEMPGFVHERPA